MMLLHYEFLSHRLTLNVSSLAPAPECLACRMCEVLIIIALFVAKILLTRASNQMHY
jgi:hypothetical protein